MIPLSEQGRRSDEPRLEVELERTPEAPSAARAAITGFSADLELDSTTVAMLTLLVSEIVTNAVVHPATPQPSTITVRARLSNSAVRVEVTDQGSGFAPTPRNPAQLDGGYGLFLLDKQATRWGVEQRPGTSVWFELAT
jgi:anti-sigma regulatory factor (Ser/Thr protein kinase)